MCRQQCISDEKVDIVGGASDGRTSLSTGFKHGVMVPAGLRAPAAPRLAGLDLKAAELVTHQLLLAGHAPSYCLLPSLPVNAPDLACRLVGDTKDQVSRTFEHLCESASSAFACLHPALDPASRGCDGNSSLEYGVPQRRAERKRQQILNIIAAASSLVLNVAPGRADGGTLVDLCGGCGHVGLVFAALFPKWQVVVVDAKPFPLQVVGQRAREANLSNVQVLETDISNLCEKNISFDIALALHACADASDIVLSQAMKAGAAAVVVPCCVGGLVSSRRKSVAAVAPQAILEGRGVPRSSSFASEIDQTEFRLLVRAADFGEDISAGDIWRRAAKSLVEADRARWCEENEYEVRLVKLIPLTCTPMNDMHVVWPQAWRGKCSERERERLLRNDSNTSNWPEDVVSNSYLRSVVADDNVLSSFDRDKVASVRQLLWKNVCAAGSDGEMWFPTSQGARERKLVHGVAGLLKLYHVSTGRGALRRVVVRRSPEWPLFFDTYVGYGGSWVSKTARSVLWRIPKSHAVQRDIRRNGRAHHITLVSPKEIRLLDGEYKYNPTALVKKLSGALRSAPNPQLVGLGRAVDSNDDKNDSFFCVLDWPAANIVRADLGLPPHDFHITVGFAEKDIHGVRKDRSTLIWAADTEDNIA